MFKLNSLMTVLGRWFCCVSLLPVLGVRVSVAFRLVCVHIILVRFGWLSFWERAAHSFDHMCLFVI